MKSFNYELSQARSCTTSIPIIITVLILSTQLNDVFSYSSGAPSSACSDLFPGHGVSEQSSSSPYKIEAIWLNNSDQASSPRVRVTIMPRNAIPTVPFKGFMIQARDSKQPEKMIEGTFSVDKNELSMTIKCGKNLADTLTHSDPSPKESFTTIWTPTSSIQSSSSFIFRATIVETKETFWIEQDSLSLTVPATGRSQSNSNEPNLSSSRSSITTLSAHSSSSSRQLVDYAEVCATSFCFGSPVGCITDNSCDSLIAGLKNTDGSVQFSLFAFAKANTYHSMGLSLNARMGDDEVTDCVIFRDGRTAIMSSYNRGYDNILYGGSSEESKLRAIKPIKSSFNDGIVHCVWNKERKSTISVENREISFDLMLNNSIHLLLASGDLSNSEGKKIQHTRRLASLNPIDFNQVGLIAASDLGYLIRIHGSLMVIAWLGFVSIAILLARHFKNDWFASTCCGVKIWFACHRGMMVMSLLLMFIAQACIFAFLDYNYIIGAHQITGSLAFTIAILNPLGALARPPPDAPNRWIFNWGHWLLGNVGHILAIVAILLSSQLTAADLPASFLYTMIGYVVFHVLVHLILQIHSCVMAKKKFEPVETSDLAGHDNIMGIGMRDMRADNNYSSANNTHLELINQQQDNLDAPGSGFRRFILGIYITIVCGFVVALVVFISMPAKLIDQMKVSM